jgi:UDP-glucose:(heptosyl)LPS alpha-1,3-glucosyltransferase
MHITLLKSHLSHTGGAEKYTWRLAHALKARGYDVTLLTSGLTDISSDFNIVSCKNAAMSFLSVHQFDRFCHDHLKKNPSPYVLGLDRNRYQTHIRASNGVHAAFLAHRAKQEGRLKSLSFSLNPLHRMLLNIEKVSFEHPDLSCLITNSHMVKKEILTRYRVNPDKIHVVHNGVEWQEMEKDFQNWQQERLLFPFQKDAFHLLFMGHNYQRKGLEPLLKALSLTSLPFHLSVVGKDKDISFFQHLVHTQNLQNRVTFFGQQSQPRKFLQVADALVVPSFYDPFANVTVEALSMGVQVISSKTNGGSEILTKDNGIIIEDLHSPDAFKAALETAFKSPKTWEKSLLVRNSVAHLDFSKQLNLLLDVANL